MSSNSERIECLHEALDREGMDHLIVTYEGKILIIMGSFVHGHVRTEPSNEPECDIVNVWEVVYPDINSLRMRSYTGESVKFRGIKGENIL